MGGMEPVKIFRGDGLREKTKGNGSWQMKSRERKLEIREEKRRKYF